MAIIDEITNLYVGYFNRAPDPEGLNFWMAQRNAGASLSGIANSFAQVPEATSLYSFLSAPLVGSPTSFLASVYLNLFGRAIDDAGSAFWAGQLALPGAAVGQIIINIISGAQGDDAQVVANKTAVGKYFVQQLVDKNLPFGTGALAASKAAFNGVTSDAATVTTAQSAVDSSISGTLAGAVASQTLTVNQDILTASVFDAPLFTSPLTGAQIQTLTSVDRLTGGTSVSDTLNATLNGTEVTTKPTMAGVEVASLTAVGASIFDAANSTGLTQVGSIDSTANLTVRNVGSLANLAVKNSATGVHTLFQLANTLTSGASDTGNLKLDSVGRGAPGANATVINVRGETAGGFETLNIESNGGASRFADLGSDPTTGIGVIATAAGSVLKTVNVTGTANLRIQNPLLNVTTLDAATFEGNLRAVLDLAKNVTVTGGKGADNFSFLTGHDNNDVLNGGDGRDTLVTTVTTGIGDGNKVTNVETLFYAGGGAVIDLSKVASFDSVVNGSAAAVTYNNLSKAGAADFSKSFVQFGTGASTISVKDANALGSNSDALVIKVGIPDPTTQLATFVAGAVTTSAIESATVHVFDVGAATATAGGAFLNADAALSSVTYSGGSAGIAFNAGVVGGTGVALTNMNGSTFIGNLTITGNAFSQVIKGGSGNDVLDTGGHAAFVLGTVSDTLSGGLGMDNFKFRDVSDGVLTGANLTAIDAPAAVTATNRGEITGISDLDLGGANVGLRADTIDFDGAVLGAVVPGGFAIVNGGAATALTGANLGVAANTLVTTGVLGGAGVGVPAAGLFTWAGDTYLIATTNTAINDNFGTVAGQDIIIKVTGVVGTLDASDFV